MAASAAASTPAPQMQVQIRKVERPTVQAKQAIGEKLRWLPATASSVHRERSLSPLGWFRRVS